MGAPFEVKHISVLKIRNAGGAAQRGLSVTVVDCSADVSVGLINFDRPRSDPGMAGREALEALLRRGPISLHSLKNVHSLQFVIVYLLLLSERESGRTLPQHH